MLKAKLMACVLFAVALSGAAYAGGDTCANATAIVPDGRVYSEYVSAASNEYFYLQTNQPRSYCVEANNWTDASGTAYVYVYDDNSCSTLTSNVYNMCDYDPAFSNGVRDCWISNNINGNYIRVYASTAQYIQLRAYDTTLWSPGVYTAAGWRTTWWLQNTTDGAFTGTIYIFDSTGTLQDSQAFTIYAGAMYTNNTVNMATPTGISGHAIIVHDGPPGGLIGNGMMVSGSTILPVAVTERHYQ